MGYHVDTLFNSLICLVADTEKIYTEVTQEIARPYGRTYGWHIKQKVMGKPVSATAICLELITERWRS